MINKINTVRDIPNNYILIDNDFDIQELNKQYNQDYGCYFALIGDGEYLALYGCESNVPYLYKSVYKVI